MSANLTNSYAEQFFGGVGSVKARLVGAIKEELTRRTWEPAQLDKICGFGKPRPKGKTPLPSCESFFADPSLMNSLVFSLASFPLCLKADTILSFNLTNDDRKAVTDEMQREDAGVKYAAGGADISDVSLSDQAKLYVLMKVLDEIDGAARVVECVKS